MKNKILIIPFLFIVGLLIYSCNESPIESTQLKTSFTGVIKDNQGLPVPNAKVDVVIPLNVVTVTEENILATQLTDEDGKFSLPEINIPLDKALFRVTHSYFKTYEKTINEFIKSNDTKNINLALQQNDSCCGTIKIKVLKASDSTTAINDVQVKLMKGSELIKKSYTNSDGKLTFENVCLKSYWLRIAKDGYKVIEKEIRIENCDSIYNFTFYLQSNNQTPTDTCCNNIISILLKNTNDETINGATVKIRKNGTLITYKISENSNLVKFRELCKGKYSFLVTREGYKPLEFEAEVDCGDSLFLTKTMQFDTCCKGYLKVFVKDSSSGNALNGTAVKLYLNGAVKATGTVENGYVQFGPYCEGNYGLYLTKDSYKAAEMSVTIECNTTKEYTKKLLATSNNNDSCCNGVYEVVVKDSATGNRLSGVSVYLYKGSTKLKASTTNDNGLVIFTGLCKGDGYSISLQKTNYKSIEWAFALDCNDTVEIAKYLAAKSSTSDSCCTGKLKLIIKDSNSNPINEVKVEMRVEGTNKYSTFSNSSGQAVIEGICSPKTYNVRISKNGYVTKEFNISYSECTTKTETITLQQ